MTSVRRLTAILVVVVTLASCGRGGDSAAEAASKTITGALTDRLGIGQLTAACDEPDTEEVGTTFACTGTAPDGRVVKLRVSIESSDQVVVETRNVLEPVETARIETEAERAAGAETGSIDCSDAVLVGDDASTWCRYVDPRTGTVGGAQVFLDVDPGGSLVVDRVALP